VELGELVMIRRPILAMLRDILFTTLDRIAHVFTGYPIHRSVALFVCVFKALHYVALSPSHIEFDISTSNYKTYSNLTGGPWIKRWLNRCQVSPTSTVYLQRVRHFFQLLPILSHYFIRPILISYCYAQSLRILISFAQ
jgi:hypothetical protein